MDLGPTLGAELVGIIASSVLHGAVLIQTYKYYQARFQSDGIYLKSMVGFLCFLETARCILLWIDIYSRTVIDFGSHSALFKITGSLVGALVLTVTTIVIVQAFFIHRLYTISSMWLFPVALGTVQLIRVGFGIAISTMFFAVNLLEFAIRFRWLFVVTFSLGAISDVANTVALGIFYEKNYNPMLRSQTLGEKIISWTIDTGFIPSIASIITMALICSENNLIWSFFWLQMAPLYCSAVLSFLNGRISLRSAQASSHVLPESIGPRARSLNPANVEVHIEMDLEIDRMEQRLYREYTQKTIV